MKKKFFVIGTVLAMLVIMVFPCYGEGIPACYQKNNGQLRILTTHSDACKPSEIAITLQGGEQIPEVPIICAGYVAGSNCDTTTNACPFTGSCVSSVSRTSAPNEGYYGITFTQDFFNTPPICVIYLYQNAHQADLVLYSQILYLAKTGFTLNTYYIPSDGGTYDVDNDFNFICTQP